MADPAIAKVEDALKAALAAWPALAAHTVIAGQSLDIAITEDEFPAIQIYTVAYQVDVADENWMTLHTATIELECVDGLQAIGTISRANQTTIAHIMACLTADRTLGGRLQDLQEIDVAPASPNGKDVSAASLQIRVQFYTTRADWFTIHGQNGLTF